MARVLIVEDEETLNDLVCRCLRAEKHSVDSALDGLTALDFIATYEYDVIVLDIRLPGVNGLELCRKIRERNHSCGVLMLTGQNEILQKTEGLDAGADDYITKPFDERELIARVRAVLRRSGESARRESVLTVGNIRLDQNSLKVMRDDETVHLTPKEYALLEFLMRHKGQVFAAADIIERVWPSDDETTSETIRSHIRNLRKKLDVDGRPSIFRTVHRVGYVVDDIS